MVWQLTAIRERPTQATRRQTPDTERRAVIRTATRKRTIWADLNYCLHTACKLHANNIDSVA